MKAQEKEHQIYDANIMIWEAGANGCKPTDRRTNYVDVNAFLDNEDSNGVMTYQFQEIYTSAPEIRKQDNELKEAYVFHYLDPGYKEERRVLPPKEAVKVCRIRELFGAPPEPFDKWGHLHRRRMQGTQCGR